jgi:hypothetical protein
MSLDDRAKAIVASNLTTALHVELASRRARVESPLGSDLPKDWKFGHPDASEEVFNTYLGFLDRLTEYDGSDHMKPE